MSKRYRVWLGNSNARQELTDTIHADNYLIAEDMDEAIRMTKEQHAEPNTHNLLEEDGDDKNIYLTLHCVHFCETPEEERDCDNCMGMDEYLHIEEVEENNQEEVQ